MFKYIDTNAPVLPDAKDLFISFRMLDCTPLGAVNQKWCTTLMFMPL